MIVKTAIGDICNIFSAGDKPATFEEVMTEKCHIPVIANGIDNDGIIGYTDKAKIYTEAVTVSARGNVGTSFYRNKPYYPVIRLLTITPKNWDEVNCKYLYYLLKNSPLQGIGSVQAQLTVPDVSKMEVFFESDYYKQTHIVDLLSTVDSKITINKSICSDLENMAKLLYDYWFVQFDFPDENGMPYKSSGGKMVWNEELKREIPEGWRAKPLVDVFDITMGSSPKGDSLNEIGNGIEFYQGSTDFGYLYPSMRVFTTAPVRYAKAQDILISVRAPVGDMNIAMNDCCIGRGLAAIHHKSTIYAWCTMQTFKPFFDIYNGNGTTFGALTSDDLKGQLTVVPNQSVLDGYCKKMETVGLKLREVSLENQQLASLRDFLLPMLMNGQVKVGKAGE